MAVGSWHVAEKEACLEMAEQVVVVKMVRHSLWEDLQAAMAGVALQEKRLIDPAVTFAVSNFGEVRGAIAKDTGESLVLRESS